MCGLEWNWYSGGISPTNEERQYITRGERMQHRDTNRAPPVPCTPVGGGSGVRFLFQMHHLASPNASEVLRDVPAVTFRDPLFGAHQAVRLRHPFEPSDEQLPGP